MSRSIIRSALLVAATLLTSPSNADDWDITGFVGLDSQAFWQDGRYAGQEHTFNTSLLVQPEFYWRDDDNGQRISVVGFARLDAEDDERSHVDLREAYWGIDGMFPARTSTVLLKTLLLNDYHDYDGVWRSQRMEMVNHQTGKSTDLIYGEYSFGVGLEDDDFVKGRLARLR